MPLTERLRKPEEAELVGLIVRLSLDGFTADEIERFMGCIAEMGWSLIPPAKPEDEANAE